MHSGYTIIYFLSVFVFSMELNPQTFALLTQCWATGTHNSLKLKTLVDYFDIFNSCLDSHSDGTHSLQRIHLQSWSDYLQIVIRYWSQITWQKL